MIGSRISGERLNKLKVAIDFRVDDLRQGHGTAIVALAQGLSRLKDVDQEYIFIVPQQAVEALRPHLSGPCSIEGIPPLRLSVLGRLKKGLARIRPLRRLWLTLRGDSLVLSSDGVIERLGADVVHFPSQIAYATSVPSIYQPWDLQHCHLPQFFTEEDLLLRDVQYRAFCRQARFVCIQTEWGKQDLIDQYGIDPEKIRIIRWGTAFGATDALSEDEVREVREEVALPEEFFVYPAVTWPHKNHVVILHALAILNQKDSRPIHVVFTGAATPFRKELEKLAISLGVGRQVHFKGFISSRQIKAVLQHATGLLFPSKFEGLGLPVLEAFHLGLPVICSSATVLPEVSQGAALLFDPDSPPELAAAIQKLITSSETRAALIEKGRIALQRYSSAEAALAFVELYRETAAAKTS